MNAKEFNELMTHVGRRMMLAAIRVTESEADAADAVQEAMIRLWQHRAELADAENQVAYASTAARRCALDIVRSRHHEVSVADTDVTNAPVDAIDARDSLAHLLRLIDSLPSPQREVLTLRHIEGLEIGEIQQQLNLTAGNIRVILSRGRATLRKQFEK